MTGERGPLDFDDRDDERPEAAPAPRAPEEPAPSETPPADVPPAPAPARPPGAGRYTWFLGVVAFLLIALVTLNSVTSEGGNPGGPDEGDRLVPFAVPLAAAPPRPDGNEDANVDQRQACGVRGRGILNVCELRERGPVVFALFPTDAARCRSVLRQFARVAPRFDDVTFAAVGSRGDRRDLVADWPGGRDRIGWDRDGAVASVYGLVGCPQISFARRGGAVVLTTRRELSDDELAGRVQELLR